MPGVDGHDAALQGGGDGLGAALDVELVEDVAHVGFHRVLGEAKLVRDALVAGTGDEQAEHLALALG